MKRLPLRVSRFVLQAVSAFDKRRSYFQVGTEPPAGCNVAVAAVECRREPDGFGASRRLQCVYDGLYDGGSCVSSLTM